MEQTWLHILFLQNTPVEIQFAQNTLWSLNATSDIYIINVVEADPNDLPQT